VPEDLLSCRDLSASITDYLEAGMAPEVTEAFEEHVGFCDDCLVHIDRLRIAAKVVGALPHSPMPAATRDAILSAAREQR
jgi:hypothetical protein